jgi:lipopolysaccharide transport system ATP-binding protein
MTKPILEIKNISKKFRIQHNAQPYLSLRDSISSLFKRGKHTTEDFYALNDVSFNVDRGESLAIIGKNGAGKSTLLKILSKITPPTAGSIICRGNVASLLEVGTGFHPELSGRENIFLNGSILGMKRKEIQIKFDEIVDFSGTEKFLDTPLKHYSSGMQLRLAFSVAAFLEPEIMIIDEVLAVGDAEFQKKCMGKMEDVSRSGRTILFVSHDLNAVSSLCKNTILLDEGKISSVGRTPEVISLYLQSEGNTSSVWSQKKSLTTPHFKSVEVKLMGQQPTHKLQVNFEVQGTADMLPSFVAFDISDRKNSPLGQAIPVLEPFINPGKEAKQYKVEIDLPALVPGYYYVGVWLGHHYNETYDWQKECVEFMIIDSPQKSRTYPHANAAGAVVPNSRLIQ